MAMKEDEKRIQTCGRYDGILSCQAHFRVIHTIVNHKDGVIEKQRRNSKIFYFALRNGKHCNDTLHSCFHYNPKNSTEKASVIKFSILMKSQRKSFVCIHKLWSLSSSATSKLFTSIFSDLIEIKFVTLQSKIICLLFLQQLVIN